VRRREEAASGDESFGPGTDLVVSLLAALFLLIPLAVQSVRLLNYLSRAREDAVRASVECRPEPEKQIWEFRESYQEEPLFEKNHAGLTEAAKRQIRAQWPAFEEALRGGLYNQLLVEGHASPEISPRSPTNQRERWNLQLSLERALAVADYLHELGLSYECISVTGFGRSHSSALREWLEGSSERSLQQWDDGEEDVMKQTEGSDLAGERLVRVLGIHHESSLCEVVQKRVQ
jgi:outer membrane protein OmpA-like peptidoglycan-associated protein